MKSDPDLICRQCDYSPPDGFYRTQHKFGTLYCVCGLKFETLEMAV